MKLGQVFEILNKEARDDSDIQLWFHDGDYDWYTSEDVCDVVVEFMYMRSETKPDFNPDLLTSDQVEKIRDLWYLDDETWVKFEYNRVGSDKEDLPVYLYQDEQPKYHPMQTRIANMLLDKPETKPNKLNEIFELLNREARNESNTQLWVNSSGSKWRVAGYDIDSYDYQDCTSVELHIKSSQQPDFNPHLLLWSDVNDFKRLWVLIDQTWTLFAKVVVSLGAKDDYVYLYQETQPSYSYLQKKIANMLLAKPEPKYEFKNTTEAPSAYILSDDQNTLKITEPSPLAGVYKAEALDDYDCRDCAFVKEICHDYKCTTYDRADERDIYWIKQEQPKVEPKQEPNSLPEPIQEPLKTPQDYQPKPHKHKELIKVWLEDTNQKVWYWLHHAKQWSEVTASAIPWSEDIIHAVGDKPTEPPEKMLKFPWGTIEFYAPYAFESKMYAGEVGDHNIFEVSTLEHYFNTSEHSDLFQKACKEYHINLEKFLKGELNAM